MSNADLDDSHETLPVLFQYAISRSQLTTRSILLSVWHHGRISRNAFLGEVEVALDCQDLDSPQEECFPLMGKVQYVTDRAFNTL